MGNVTLAAEVQSVVFFNEENGYVIARVRADEEPGLTTIIGTLGKLTPGECLTLHGTWKEHPKFGRQFEVATFEQAYPATENGVIKFLQTSIKGVGPKMAAKLVDAYGVTVLDILDEDPKQLLKFKGISRKKLEGIIESWRERREIKGLIVFLHSHSIPPTYAGRIFQLYGAQAVSRIEENPYELAYEIRGIGFKRADDMALKLGFAPDSPKRLAAAMTYVLFSQSEKAGHLFLPREILIESTSAMLNHAISPHTLETSLEALAESKRVRFDRIPGEAPDEEDVDGVFLTHFYKYERETTERLAGLLAHPAPVSREKVAAALPKIEEAVGIALSEEQRAAVFEACVNKVFIITGGPGTGKTTITRAVVATLRELGLKVKLAAPTGRAAKRLAEATDSEASTVHRMLQFQPDGCFLYDGEKKLKTDVLVVDEASMLDSWLCVSILRALPLTSRLVLVGDVNQLPSVGPGNVLSDMLGSGVIPHAVLTHIFRQAQESQIVLNAHRINAGQFPEGSQKPPPEADFFWVSQEDPAKVRSIILETVCERIPERYGLDPLRDVQVLTPMHKGEVGTQALNTLLQERLNPKNGPEIVRGHTRFREGDRVLMLRNNYDKDVFNGDLGWVLEMDKEEGEIFVEFDGRQVLFEASELDELALAYAISVHKSQGSEYPAIVVPVVTQHYIMLQRNLIYTALTRARSLAVLVGSDKALRIGLGNVNAGKRFTSLKSRLKALEGRGMILG